MLPLNRVPGIPISAVSQLADLGVDSAERLLRYADNPITRGDLERQLGGATLERAAEAARRALGLDVPADVTEPDPEPAQSRSIRSTAIAKPQLDRGALEVLRTMGQIREKMTALSDRKWGEFLEASRGRMLPDDIDPARVDADQYGGDLVLLTGVDPTQQVGRDEKLFVVHRDERGRYWAIRVDGNFMDLTREIRDAQTTFGWPRETTWDVIGEFREQTWSWHVEEVTHQDRTPSLVPIGIRLRDQFAVLRHSTRGVLIPGLASAREKLAAARGDAQLPLDVAPAQIVPVIVQALMLNDTVLFRQLWAKDIGDSSVRYSFTQFRRAFDACDGRIAFERYDARQNPEQYPACGEVKVFVRRQNTDGTETSRPLTFVQEDGSWRIRSGTI